MMVSTVIQRISQTESTPSDSDIDDWIRKTLIYACHDDADITLRIVDEPEIEQLNCQFRKVSAPTNVLAFAYNERLQAQSKLLGDVVVCAGVINRQAAELKTPPTVHWARIITHGVLHLCGYDHFETDEALQMESAERWVLKQCGFVHPDLAEIAI